MNLAEQAAAHAAAYEAQYKRLKAAGVKFLQGHMVDMAGGFRSKISPLKFSASGDALNGILYCVSHGDGQPTGDTVFASPIAHEGNGYPNIQAVADPASIRHHGWRPDTASVISTGYMLDGTPACWTRATYSSRRMRACVRRAIPPRWRSNTSSASSMSTNR